MAFALTRRAFIAGGVAVSAASSGTVWGLSSGVPRAGARVLTAAEWAVVEAVSLVFFPGVHFPLNGLQANVAAEVDRLLHEVMAPVQAHGFRVVLRGLEWGTLASRGRYFTGLSTEEQHDVLSTWCTPDVMPRRIAGDALRVLLGMAYFAHPEVKAAMGWQLGCGG